MNPYQASLSEVYPPAHDNHLGAYACRTKPIYVHSGPSKQVSEKAKNVSLANRFRITLELYGRWRAALFSGERCMQGAALLCFRAILSIGEVCIAILYARRVPRRR